MSFPNLIDKPIKLLEKPLWPSGLNHIPCPPKKLWIRGLENFKKLKRNEPKFLTVVGSRNFTEYGEKSCRELISGLKGYNICIVSGLAYGIDALAHQMALENNIPTIAFPGSGLDSDFIYPKAHLNLAKEILEHGGSLISEFDHRQDTRPWMFPQRNRLMVGICDSALIIEAGKKSGSGITANMAIEYDRNLMAVPGSIFNHNSKMTNELIQSGAKLVTKSSDILEEFCFDNLFNEKISKSRLNVIEREILKLIQSGLTSQDEILEKMKIPVSELNRAISKLEIDGLI